MVPLGDIPCSQDVSTSLFAPVYCRFSIKPCQQLLSTSTVSIEVHCLWQCSSTAHMHCLTTRLPLLPPVAQQHRPSGLHLYINSLCACECYYLPAVCSGCGQPLQACQRLTSHTRRSLPGLPPTHVATLCERSATGNGQRRGSASLSSRKDRWPDKTCATAHVAAAVVLARHTVA